MNGPFRAGLNDVQVFKNEGLKAKLRRSGKMAIGDGGYGGHPYQCSTIKNQHDSKAIKKFKSRALKRHERFNGLTKAFDCHFRIPINSTTMVLDDNNQQNGQGNNKQQQNEKKKKSKEPKIKWKDSKARVILYKDLAEGKIPRHATDQYGKSTMKLEVIFQMHEEYKLYDREKFSSRLSKVRDIYDDCMHRKSMDEEAFNIFLHNHKPSLFSHKGYPEWQGSNAQSLLRDDIEAEKRVNYM